MAIFCMIVLRSMETSAKGKAYLQNVHFLKTDQRHTSFMKHGVVLLYMVVKKENNLSPLVYT